MMTRNSLRSWFVGTACLCLTFAGCAAPSAGTPLAENRVPPKQKLKDPKGLHLAHARWQEHVGNATAARESYEFVLEKDKKSVDAIIGLARLDHLAGRTDEAERGFLKALEIEPASPTALASAGQFYAAHEQWEPAIKMLQAAGAAAPQDSNYEYHLAVVLARSGDIAGARKHFVNTLGEAEAHYNIGYIQKESGDLAAAEQEFLLALTIKPELENAKVLLDEIRNERQQELVLTAAAAPTIDRGQAVHAGGFRPGAAATAPQTPHRTGSQQYRGSQGTGVTQNADYRAPAQVVQNPTQTAANGPWKQPAPIQPPADAELTPRQREQLLNQLGQ